MGVSAPARESNPIFVVGSWDDSLTSTLTFLLFLVSIWMISCPFWIDSEQGEEGSISVCFRASIVHAGPIIGRQALRVTYYSATLVTRVQRLTWTCPGHRGVPARPILCDRGNEDSSERALVFPVLTVEQYQNK